MNMKHTPGPRLAMLACMLTLSATAVSAQNASIVVRDVDTGQLRSATAEEVNAMQSPTTPQRSSAAGVVAGRGVVSGSMTPRTWTNANGVTISETTEDMMSSSVAIRGANGKLVRQCAGSAVVAERLTSGKKMSFAKNMLERQYASK